MDKPSGRPPKAKRPGSTATDLLEAGERLLGANGLSGISLRQIVAESGSANPSAVHYHFGDLRGLVQAILEFRQPEIEQARASLYEPLEGQALSLEQMLEIVYRPLLEGRAAYARFLSELRQSSYFDEWSRMQLGATVTGELTRRVRASVSVPCSPLADARLRSISTMILREIAADPDMADAQFRDLVRIGAAALTAPGVADDAAGPRPNVGAESGRETADAVGRR